MQFGLQRLQRGSVIVPNLQAACAAYERFLGQQVLRKDTFSVARAVLWDAKHLAGCPTAVLAASSSEKPWLELIEAPFARPIAPLQRPGWLALEVCVEDVDRLRDSLGDNSPFRVIGEPADLAISDHIRAMQVVGPANEVLYLTEVKAPLPPFKLPLAAYPVDHLFIAVLGSQSLDEAVQAYRFLAEQEALRFDTKITVLSRANQLPDDHQHPAATIQLPESTLFEIDQLPQNLGPSPLSAVTGIVAVGCYAEQQVIADWADAGIVQFDPVLARGIFRGPDNERLELIAV